MKKLFSLFLVALLLFSAAASLSSCGVDYTEDDVISAAEKLITDSYEVNEIFFGKGLEIDETLTNFNNEYEGGDAVNADDVEVQSVRYAVVSEDSGYTSVDQLKQKALSTYTQSYCDIMFVAAFDGVRSDELSEIVYSRFMINLYDQLAQRSDVKKNGMDLGTDYDLSSLKVETMKANEATVSVTYTYTLVKDGSETQQTESTVLTLKKNENGAWRLDTPTYYLATVED